MKKMNMLPAVMVVLTTSLFFLCRCTNNQSSAKKIAGDSSAIAYGGFENQIQYGKHLVTIAGCNDCHTPKKMTPMGPAPDTSLLLSGHPASMPLFAVDRKELESKGLAATNDMTAWVGPWGVSYSANLTPDSSGIGTWTEEQFMRAIREGKFKGLEESRPLLPPMPWQELRSMTDPELQAIFAYLKSIKPVHNVVPAPQPPAAPPHH
jgi:hypothetical protein